MKAVFTLSFLFICTLLLSGCVSVVLKKDIPIDWQSSSTSDFQFQYPQNFSGHVRSPLARPPVVKKISLSQDPIKNACPELENTILQSGNVQGKTNDGLNYSLYQGSDVGAGQLYSLYCYVVKTKDSYYVFDVTIHSANGCGGENCGPYCDTPFEQECKSLDSGKIAQELTDIVGTLHIK